VDFASDTAIERYASEFLRWSQERTMAQGWGLGTTEETFEGTGGLKIFFRSLRPQAKPRALVVICHGVNSHGGQYSWVAEQLVKAGLPHTRSISAAAGDRKESAFT
jgi:hypothetical protein